jgi:release factor glutamine methyltransferase
VAVAAAVYCPDLRVLATDVSAAALAVAGQNVQRHGICERVILAEADLLTLPPGQGRGFDIIVANPPYVSDAQMADLPKAVQAEPALALRGGPAGLDCIARIIADAPGFLAAGGLLAIEIGQGQGPAVYDLLNQAGGYEEIRLRKDSAGIERVAVAVRK